MNDKDNQNSSIFTSVILKKSGKQGITKLKTVPNKAVDDLSVDVKNISAKNDKRVQLTKYFIVIVFLISVASVLSTDRVLNEIFVLAVLFFILAAINYMGFFILRKDVSGSLVFSLLSLYIWVAYPLKLIVAIHDPSALWISKILIDPKIVSEEISGSFILLFPALVSLFFGLFIFQRTRDRKEKYLITGVNNKLFITAIISLIFLRVFNQVVLNIGIPGVQPQMLPVPYLNGVLELMSRPVLFALVNLYFYYVIRLNDRKAIWVSLGFLLINIVLGLRVGYKSELVLQGLLLIYYSFEVFPYLSKINRKLMITVTASVILITAVLYPLINDYRSYLLSGKSFSEAVESAQKKSDKNGEPVSLALLNRVNGIGEYYAAIKLGEGSQFGYAAFFNDSVMDLIKQRLYGANKDNASVAFGTTAFSVAYLIGGSWLLLAFGFGIGFLIRLSSIYLRYYLFKSTYTFQAYLPLFCILWVKLLSSGGQIPLYFKEIFLVVVCLFLIERYATTNKTQ